jgi:hypothetical protein
VINLYATGRMGDILATLPEQVAVAAFVYEEEALHIGADPSDPNLSEEELIDLQPFVEHGLLLVVSPKSDEENQTYISFAATLDDGEAITGAIALHRNWAIGSDDGGATRFFSRHTPPLHVITTPEIIQYWVDAITLPPDQIRAVLQRVRVRARYMPATKHPLYNWWSSHM